MLLPALGLVAAVALSVPAVAPAATITACVHKTSGEVKIRSGKAAKRKCPKGWKRVRWTDAGKTGKNGKQGAAGIQGVQGIQGPAGPQLSVKDTTGAVVGQFLGIFPQPYPIYIVARDGGHWYYLGSGHLYPVGGSPVWKTADCSGTAYLEVGIGSLSTPVLLTLIGGPFRWVFRTLSSGTFGASSAWKAKGTVETLGAPTQLYDRDMTTGACAADGAPVTGDLFPLEPVTAPPDFAGPLAIG
jgi:hypothetical protein